MWKTFYDMFAGEPHQQELYHAIAAVGTLLLEIGEVGKKFYLQREELSATSSPAGSASLTESLKEAAPEVDTKLEACKDGETTDKSKTVQSVGDTNISEKVCEKVAELNLSVDSKGDFTAQELKNDLEPTDSSVPSSSPSLTHRGERTVSSSSSKIDSDWSITFEQFLASMLTEPALVRYFETAIDLTEAVDRTRHRRLLMRQASSAVETVKK